MFMVNPSDFPLCIICFSECEEGHRFCSAACEYYYLTEIQKDSPKDWNSVDLGADARE